MLDAQRDHWEREYATPQRFGSRPSAAARYAARIFAGARARRVLELGCGHGRDALYFAARGFEVAALDYAAAAIAELGARAERDGLAARLRASAYDARTRLPFRDASVDAIFAHMFHNMAFVDRELEHVFAESYRVLRANGTVVFTVRATDDPDAREGVGIDGFLRDVGGDVIRFFSEACVNRFCARYETIARRRLEEGSLPKRLWLVTLRKPGGGASGPDASQVRLNEC